MFLCDSICDVKARGVTASTLIAAPVGRALLAMAALTGCTAYDDSLVDPGSNAETGGSSALGGRAGAGVAGGTTTGSGGVATTDGSTAMGGDSTDAAASSFVDVPTSMNDETRSRDAAPGPDESSDGASSLQPILHYKFDETSGNVVNDSSGNARTGTVIGTHTWVTGRVGNAMTFDGASAFVVLPIGIVSSLTEMTIATWVQFDANKVWQRIVDFGNNTTVYMFLTPTSMAGTVQLAITTTSNPGQQLLNGTGALPLATWKHIAVVLDGKNASLYVDGALDSTSAVTTRPADLGTTANNWLGRSQYAQDPYFKGQLDDFRLYDRALTAEQIAAIANP